MRIDNADELPYYVVEDARPVQVRFLSLEAGDEEHINDRWTGSIYFALWQQIAKPSLSICISASSRLAETPGASMFWKKQADNY